MRGFLLVGGLVALAYVGYLQMESSKQIYTEDQQTLKTEQVRQDVEKAMQDNLEKLKKMDK